MNPPFLLALQPSALPALSPRSRPHQPQLRPADPAVQAMSDFLDDPPRTIAEDADLEEVVDHMFRLGVRVFLVVRDRSVIGLITAEDADAARRVSVSASELEKYSPTTLAKKFGPPGVCNARIRPRACWSKTALSFLTSQSVRMLADPQDSRTLYS